MEQPVLLSDIRIRSIVIWLTCLGLILAACGSVISTEKPILTSSPSATTTPIPTSTPTPTPQSPVAVLLAGAGADEGLVSNLQTNLNDTIQQAGLRWQVQHKLTTNDLTSGLRMVVAVPPDPGLAELADAAPDTQFVALGIAGLAPAPNLTIIGESDSRPDQQGFIAGMIAAMLSDDWRVGVISLSDTIAGRAARTGFLNGVIYFCGLCRPAHPPFYEYPLYIELPSTATSAEWQEAANYMVDHFAQTVFVYQGVRDENMLSVLATSKVNIISSGIPPEVARKSWVVSLTSDPLPLIQSQVAGLLDGSLTGGQTIQVPIEFSQINPIIFTPGKQRLAQQVLDDLQADFIDTGVDLSSGENRP